MGSGAMGNIKKYRSWYEKRFDGPRAGAVEVNCQQCGRTMWLPPSRAEDYTRCSKECRAEWRLAEHQKRARPCATCGEIFYPRQAQIKVGQGEFCSQKCNTKSVAVITSPETKAKAEERRRELRAAGLWRGHPPKGPQNKRWKGGKKASQKRYVESGASAAAQRAYYAAAKKEKHSIWNRENHARRREKMGGRLPYGTIPSIGEQQRWRCAACRKGIRKVYHIDHIIPLCLGGRHEPRNIQLLCPTCNLRKGGRRPEEYMRQLGHLL